VRADQVLDPNDPVNADDPGKDHQHSDAALQQLTARVGRVAGLAALGFARKEALEEATADLMHQLDSEANAAAATAQAAAGSDSSGGAAVPTVGAVAAAVAAYLGNLESDIRSEKFRKVTTVLFSPRSLVARSPWPSLRFCLPTLPPRCPGFPIPLSTGERGSRAKPRFACVDIVYFFCSWQVSTSAKYYMRFIAPYPAAAALLQTAGFKPGPEESGAATLVVKHRNVAAVGQRGRGNTGVVCGEDWCAPVHVNTCAVRLGPVACA
jgi:hypothetical protein